MITELFLAQASRDRRFYGIIQRHCDDNGIPFVYSEIRINQGYIYSRADTQDNLGQQLDQMAILILDYCLHDQQGKIENISETDFFLN